MMLFKFIFYLFVGATLSQPVKKDNHYYDRQKFYNHKYFEGDILSYASDSLKYHAITSDSMLWPNGEVVYQVDQSVDTGLISSAMEQITQATNGCIKFRERQSTDLDYVNIFAGEGCFAEVGKKGGEQQLSLGQGCSAIGVYVHELLHTLGFYHHHSRSDRDEYLDIFWENIVPSLASNFRKLEPSENQLLTPFDYQSLMMYGSLAFSKDNVHYTMLPKDPTVQISDPGTKSGMTSLDITSLRKLYSCDSSPTSNDLEDEKPGNNNHFDDKTGDKFEDKFGDNIIGGNFGDHKIGDTDNPDDSNDDDKSILPPIPSLNDYGKQIDKNDVKLNDLKGSYVKNLGNLKIPSLKGSFNKHSDEGALSFGDLSDTYEKQSNNHLKINELTGSYGELGNLIDFSKVIGSIMKRK